jgi:amino acid transporter
VQTVTAAKLIPLLILVAFGLFAIDGANLAWPGMPPSDDVARTSVTLLFAFLGIESALTPSGEVRDPVRTVPRAILATIAIVTTLYIALQLVAQGVLGAELATSPQAPLAETAKRVLGSGGQMLILAGAAISTFGYVAGDVLASPRGIFALARDGLFPSVVGRVHERYRTPYVAILVHATLGAGFAVTGSFAGLVVFATLATLIVYVICCAATIQLQRKDIRTEGATPFRVPGGPIVPVLALGVVIWLMSASTQKEFIGLAVMLAIETVLYLVMRRVRKA